MRGLLLAGLALAGLLAALLAALGGDGFPARFAVPQERPLAAPSHGQEEEPRPIQPRAGIDAPAAVEREGSEPPERRPARDGRTELLVRVVNASDHSPIPDARVDVRRFERARKIVHATTQTTEHEGLAVCHLERGGTFQVTATIPYAFEQRTIDIRTGARMELELTVTPAETLDFWVALHDAATGASIDDDTLVTLTLSGAPIEPEAGGLWRVTGRAGSEQELEIRVRGYLLRKVPVVEGHETAARAQRVELEHKPLLIVAAQDHGGRRLDGVRFFVGVSGAITGGDGTAQFEALPAGEPRTISQGWSGGDSYREFETLTLAPGEVRELALTVRGGARLDVSVTDGRGAAVEGTRLYLRPAELRRPPGRAAPARSPTWFATTDANGLASFESVSAGVWWIVPGVPGVATSIEVSAWDGARSVALVLDPGLSIEAEILLERGSGEDPAGASPEAGEQPLEIAVWAQSEGAVGLVHWLTNQVFSVPRDSPISRTFRSEGLLPGLYTVHTSVKLDGVPYEAHADVQAGERVVLRLVPSE